ncbi:hypothetical protein Tco_0635832 [Tanacetum coccineum]
MNYYQPPLAALAVQDLQQVPAVRYDQLSSTLSSLQISSVRSDITSPRDQERYLTSFEVVKVTSGLSSLRLADGSSNGGDEVGTDMGKGCGIPDDGASNLVRESMKGDGLGGGDGDNTGEGGDSGSDGDGSGGSGGRGIWGSGEGDMGSGDDGGVDIVEKFWQPLHQTILVVGTGAGIGIPAVHTICTGVVERGAPHSSSSSSPLCQHHLLIPPLRAHPYRLCILHQQDSTIGSSSGLIVHLSGSASDEDSRVERNLERVGPEERLTYGSSGIQDSSRTTDSQVYDNASELVGQKDAIVSLGNKMRVLRKGHGQLEDDLGLGLMARVLYKTTCVNCVLYVLLLVLCHGIGGEMGF